MALQTFAQKKVSVEFPDLTDNQIKDTNSHFSSEISCEGYKGLALVFELSKDDDADGTITIRLWVDIDNDNWGEVLDGCFSVLTINMSEFNEDTNQYKQYVADSLVGSKIKFEVVRSSSNGTITIDSMKVLLY